MYLYINAWVFSAIVTSSSHEMESSAAPDGSVPRLFCLTHLTHNPSGLRSKLLIEWVKASVIVRNNENKTSSITVHNSMNFDLQNLRTTSLYQTDAMFVTVAVPPSSTRTLFWCISMQFDACPVRGAPAQHHAFVSFENLWAGHLTQKWVVLELQMMHLPRLRLRLVVPLDW